MSFRGQNFFFALATIVLVVAAGCSPSDQSAADEEKEFHFEQGNNCFNAMDYPGAVEAFRAALEVNPRSAQAHYRLAQLFDSKQPDPAAAVYHYQEYLRLNPRAENTVLIRDRIAACKERLTADVMSMPTAPAAMHQIEILTQTNSVLKAQIAQLQSEKRELNDYITSLQSAARNNPPPQNNFSAPMPVRQNPSAPNFVTPLPVHVRTYAVKAGETMAAIARKNGVSLSALTAANPGVNPKKLRVGQMLSLP
jgi:LysM repeat protein